MIADGHAVAVASKVFDDLLWAGERLFGIHHPVGLVHLPEQFGGDFKTGTFGNLKQTITKLCPENFAERFNREKKIVRLLVG
jgi:hypothetical protein